MTTTSAVAEGEAAVVVVAVGAAVLTYRGLGRGLDE